VCQHRKHRCAQCGEAFCATRSDARLCSPRCRKRHERGSRDKSAPIALRGFLEKHHLAQAGALSVPPAVALAEVNAAVYRLQAQGLRTVLPLFTEATFRSALKEAAVAPA
jgi:hypothetical protein